MGQPQSKAVIGILITIVGLTLVLALIFFPEKINTIDPTRFGVYSSLIIALLIIGVYVAFDIDIKPLLKLLSIPSSSASILDKPAPETTPKTLSDEERRERVEYAQVNPPPAAEAPAFNALTDVPDLATVPSVDPMIPMYLLDKNFRILDWNHAFSLAFDRSLEGRRGMGAVEWVYLLDNWKDALDHGRRVFCDPDNLPEFDKEELHFTSVNYGQLQATKRAFKFTDDDGEYAGWLVTLDIRFSNPKSEEQFRFDLLSNLSRALLWSEYALSYDELLTNSPLYTELLEKILGIAGDLPEIDSRAKVLDLGAGTGNVCKKLMSSNGTQRLVFALENNRIMYNILRVKCRDKLRRDDAGPGVIILKQDITSLMGIADDYFDAVIANNVLYSLPDPIPCLREAYRVLKPGGEIRVSGPAPGVNVDKLFKHIRSDLVSRHQFENLKRHFDQAQRINTILEPDLKRWSKRDLDADFRTAGFDPEGPAIKYYAGNGAIYRAFKPTPTLT